MIEDSKKIMKDCQQAVDQAKLVVKMHEKTLSELRPKLEALEEECKSKFGVTLATLKKNLPAKQKAWEESVAALAKKIKIPQEGAENDG